MGPLGPATSMTKESEGFPVAEKSTKLGSANPKSEIRNPNRVRAAVDATIWEENQYQEKLGGGADGEGSHAEN